MNIAPIDWLILGGLFVVFLAMAIDWMPEKMRRFSGAVPIWEEDNESKLFCTAR